MNIFSTLEIGFFQGIIFYPVVLSLALSYRLLKFPDITIEGTFALGGAVFGALVTSGESYLTAAIGAMLSSALAGGFSASLHYYFNVNKFLAGIIVVTGLYSIIARVLGGSNLSLLNFRSFDLTTLKLYIIYAIIVGIISLILFYSYKSKFGIKIRGASLNPDLSKSLGQNAGLLLILGLSLNNAIAALSGVFFTLDAGFADLKMGVGTLIVALAAMTIGERMVPRKKMGVLTFVILSALVGTIFYQILWSFALQLNVKPSDLKLLSALIVVGLFVLKRRDESDDEL